jgi:phosphohistidine phosphatase
MALYLVQHGKSLPKDVDPGRGLSKEGVSEVELIAGVAGNYHVKVEKIFHSGKQRAAQTATLFSDTLKPTQGVAEMQGLGPLDDVDVLAPKLNAGADVMLVGHLPFMERLVSRLTTGSVDHTVFKFQNGGIVCLDQEAENWHIKWALMPKID